MIQFLFSNDCPKAMQQFLAKAKEATTTTMTGGSSVKEGKMISNPNK